MKVNWKFLRVCWVPAAMLLLTGCGGFSASRSFSPLDFILPGLGKVASSAPTPEIPLAAPVTTLAKLD